MTSCPFGNHIWCGLKMYIATNQVLLTWYGVALSVNQSGIKRELAVGFHGDGL